MTTSLFFAEASAFHSTHVTQCFTKDSVMTKLLCKLLWTVRETEREKESEKEGGGEESFVWKR